MNGKNMMVMEERKPIEEKPLEEKKSLKEEPAFAPQQEEQVVA